VTLFDRAYNALAGAGLPVYRGAEKIGPCKSTYLVVYDGGMIPASKATGYRVIGVAAFAPIGKREEIEAALRAADVALAPLKMRPRGSRSAEGIDKEYKAPTQSTEYMAPCALEGGHQSMAETKITGGNIANCERAKVVTIEETPKTYVIEVATNATFTGVVSAGAEQELRVKNTIPASCGPKTWSRATTSSWTIR
jgi:hypothetical protein